MKKQSLLDRFQTDLLDANLIAIEMFAIGFALRFAVTLLIPFFDTFSASSAFSFIAAFVAYPWLLAVILLIPVVIWCYGYWKDNDRHREVGMMIMTFIYTFLAVALGFGDWSKSGWTAYMFIAGSSSLAYNKLRIKRKKAPLVYW